jgi:lambda family phage portal protein
MAEIDRTKLATKGSPILNAWRAGQERTRKEAAAQRELQQAMQAMRGAGVLRGNSADRRATAAQRLQAGMPQPAFGLVSGQRAFNAGASDRLTAGWVSATTSINADLEGALSVMVARSRSWAVNTDMGRRYIQLVKDNIVGSSAPRLQVRAPMAPGRDQLDEVGNNAIELHWNRWCERGNCEITGRMSFAEVCRTVVAAAARDGDYLARKVWARALPYGYALQVLDIDRLYTGRGNAGGAPGSTVRLGVETDALGRTTHYHLYPRHPGDSMAGAPAEVQRVPAGEVLHGFVMERPEQLRGYPWTAAVLKRADTLDSYEYWALIAAKIGAAKMGFYTIDKDAATSEMSVEDLKDATGQLVQDVEAGMVEALPPGVGFESFNPDYPHQNFGSFVTVCARGIASGLNVAHHNLTGDMTGVNYSSARIAELAERQHWMALQTWLIDSFVRPVFLDWLGRSLLAGAITLPSGKALPAETFDKWAANASFQGRRWAWVDPKGDMDAATTAIAHNLRSHRMVADEQGVELDDVLSDEARYRERLNALGLPLPVVAGAPAPVAAPDKPDTPDGNADDDQPGAPQPATDETAA